MKSRVMGDCQARFREKGGCKSLSLLDRYVDHVSLMTDLKVIAITFKKLIKPEGINQSGHASMEAFNGKN